MNKIISASQALTRRSFLSSTSKTIAGAAALSTLPIERFAHGAISPGDTLKIALVGCGGRGSGAASQALTTGESVKLVAVADVHKDRMDGSLKGLAAQHKHKVEVPDDHKFIGFDAYKQAISLADVVILATPPGFRPMQFEEAVRQGKHIFTEKPVAVDGTGVRRFLAAAEEAKKKNLKVGVGLQRHHHPGHIECIKRLQDGAIGDIVAMRAYWNGNTPWVKPRRVKIGNEKPLEEIYGRPLTEMEYQLRNWYYFVWLCGDHICEQHIHNLDMVNWLKNGHPVSARGNGGCETRKGPDYGEIFDHHVVEFTYPDGSVCFSQCRHQLGCWNQVDQHAIGTKGRSDFERNTISLYEPNAWLGGKSWRYSEKAKDPYQQEHDDLFDAIRNDKPYNEAEYSAHSTLTSILGRMSTYTGKEVTWEQAMNSKLDTMPKNLAWDAPTPTSPGPDGLYQLPVPGKTRIDQV